MSTHKSFSSQLIERDREAVARPTLRIPFVVAGGSGAILRDVDGREVIDLTSGWNVVNTGWNHPRVLEAVRQQASLLPFAPPWCSHVGRVEVAESISELLGGDWAVLCGAGGSEAVEAALKVARRATGRQAIVGFTEAYHGGTLGAMLAGGVPQLKDVDLPPTPFHRHAPIPDMLRRNGRDFAALARAVILADPAPAAVLLETVFTNPGVLYGNAEFYSAVVEATRQVGAILIVDEIGTGFGRTGKMFAFENWGLAPDIITVAKAITSGAVPMAGAVLRKPLAKAIAGPGFSSTFGWTPLACAAANATLDIIAEEGLVERARLLGIRAMKLLQPLADQCPHVAAIRGVGLEIGIELVDAENKPIARSQLEPLLQQLMARGVFAEPSSYTSTLLLMPPLVITESQLDQALTIVCEEIIRFDAVSQSS